MKKFTYTPDLTGLKILKTKKAQQDFFYSGHPDFLIPDFCEDPSDIWLSFLGYLEREIEDETYDQNGGEVSDNEIISPDGLTKCVYTAYDIQLTEDSEEEDYTVDITGYVVENTDEEEMYFVATEVIIN